MRVLYVAPNFHAGGAERQASLLLPGLQRRGVDARALALDSGGPFVYPLLDSGVPVEVLGMRHQLDVMPLVRSRLVRAFSPDVILSSGVSGMYVGQAVARWRGVANVYNDHLPVGVPMSRRRVAMIRLVARRLSSVIVVSADQCGVWLRYGCSPERIIVIPNGVPMPASLNARAAIRDELGISTQSVVAVIAAAMRPVKRVPDFVRGVLKARETCPELVGLVAGDGPDRAIVERTAAGDPAIRLLGERNDVPRILEAADILVLPSTHEAFPMAILEAMAAGLPVIATSVGGVAKLVTHEETGLLVPPLDVDALARGLVRLTTNRELRVAMGALGRERCGGRWDAEKMVDAYRAALQRTVAHNGDRPCATYTSDGWRR